MSNPSQAKSHPLSRIIMSRRQVFHSSEWYSIWLRYLSYPKVKRNHAMRLFNCHCIFFLFTKRIAQFFISPWQNKTGFEIWCQSGTGTACLFCLSKCSLFCQICRSVFICLRYRLSLFWFWIQWYKYSSVHFIKRNHRSKEKYQSESETVFKAKWHIRLSIYSTLQRI